MPWRITSISSTQFRVQKTDELTDTIVEESEDFNIDECQVSVDIDGLLKVLKKADAQGYQFFITNLAAPTFTNFTDLNFKLQPICFT